MGGARLEHVVPVRVTVLLLSLVATLSVVGSTGSLAAVSVGPWGASSEQDRDYERNKAVLRGLLGLSVVLLLVEFSALVLGVSFFSVRIHTASIVLHLSGTFLLMLMALNSWASESYAWIFCLTYLPPGFVDGFLCVQRLIEFLNARRIRLC